MPVTQGLRNLIHITILNLKQTFSKMKKNNFYEGLNIGRLTLIEKEKIGDRYFWLAKCQCNNEQKFSLSRLCTMKSEGRIFECSKCKKERKSPTLTNKIFGRLTVIREVPGKDHHRWWLCKCECGVEKEIPGIRLFSKTKKKLTKSCGCLARKLHSRWVNTTQYPPAHKLRTKNTHELKKNLYHIRNSIVASCYRKTDDRFKNHGKQGEEVCDLWRNGASDFVKWAISNGFQKGCAVSLREGSLLWCPENCFIEEKKEAIARKNSKKIEYKGDVKNISEWANELGCSIACLSNRLKKYNSFGLEKIFDLSWSPTKTPNYGTEHFEQDIIHLYKEGFSYEEIVKKLGCATSTIKRFLKKNKIEIRPSCCRSALDIKKRLKEIHDLKKSGKKLNEISNELKLNYQSITYHYRNFLKSLKKKEDKPSLPPLPTAAI